MSKEEIARALERIPIFPLPQAHLFPGLLLPLHVFEPRYRAMIRDVVSGPKLLAVCELEPGYESDYEGRPAVFPVCGLGRLIWHQVLPDGRYNILLKGEARIMIEREHPPERIYRTVRARRLAERGDDSPTLAGEAAAVMSLCRRIAPSLPDAGEHLLDMLKEVTEPGALADVLAGSLIREAPARRALLEELDIAVRLTRVSTELTTLATTLSATKPASMN